MDRMTTLEKEEFKKICDEETIDDITYEEIEDLLKLQKEWQLHPWAATKDTLLKKMAKVILKDDENFI